MITTRGYGTQVPFPREGYQGPMFEKGGGDWVGYPGPMSRWEGGTPPCDPSNDTFHVIYPLPTPCKETPVKTLPSANKELLMC